MNYIIKNNSKDQNQLKISKKMQQFKKQRNKTLQNN